MERKSIFDKEKQLLWQQIQQLVEKKTIPERYGTILARFFGSYLATLELNHSPYHPAPILTTFLRLVKEQCRSPHSFQPIHRAIRSPFDYYQFGIDFLLPLVDLSKSTLLGIGNLREMEQKKERGENVILFANHQIEADPQVISILLADQAPAFAENLFFVAGNRVISDPLAIPFSMGRNLICIYSKKHIDTPKEEKRKKQLHNRRTLTQMVSLLNEGGHAIYVAPSGGRDRIDPQTKNIEVARFDPQSIDLFLLMAKKSTKKTHFYSLALSTHHLLPPPETTEIEIGEQRTTKGGAIHLAFGKNIDTHHSPFIDQIRRKREMRQKRASYIWEQVRRDYSSLPK